MLISDHFLHYALPVTLVAAASGASDAAAIAIGASAGLLNSAPDIIPILWALVRPQSPDIARGALGIPYHRGMKLLLHSESWFNALWWGHVSVDNIYHIVDDWWKDRFLRHLAITQWAVEAVYLIQVVLLLWKSS